MEMTLKELTVAMKALSQVEIADLRETMACLDVENQDLLKENMSLKGKNHSLQEMADGFRATMEEMQQTVEDIREKTAHAHRKISRLDLQNKSLLKANEELTKELHEVSCQVDLFEDFKAAQERDLVEMQNLTVEVKKYLRRLEEMEQRYQEAQLRETVRDLLPIRENQMKGIEDLWGRVEMPLQRAVVLRLEQKNNVQVGSPMHGIVEARLVNGALNRTRKNITHWLWRLGKFLAPLVSGGGLLGSAFLYTYFIHHQLIWDTVLILLGDEEVKKIVEVLSQYLTWKNDGLLHF